MHEITQNFSILIAHYGSIALFVLLAIGIVGLPIPDETLLALTGLSIAQGKMSWFEGFSAALAGSICGITISYILGRTAGKFLIEKFGPKIGISTASVEYVHTWFEKIGKWSLFFGYFVPGVRHLTGYVAGTTLLEYRTFALFAYLGALLWVTVFLLLGYFLGAKIFTFLQTIDREILYAFAAVSILLVGCYFFWWRRKK